MWEYGWAHRSSTGYLPREVAIWTGSQEFRAKMVCSPLTCARVLWQPGPNLCLHSFKRLNIVSGISRITAIIHNQMAGV